MNKIANFLTGYKLLEEIDSPINGKITVEKDWALGTYIRSNGLTQSGSIAKLIWLSTLKKVKNKKFTPQNALILGLGGGSIAEIVSIFWPKAKITGVDIDPIMVGLGKKYMNLKRLNVKIHIKDALEFLKHKKQKSFDLICVDTYQGDKFPEKFEDQKFLSNLKKNLSRDGIVVFNRLYYGEKRPLAMKFLTKLEKNFPKIEVVHPEANIMFICFSH